MLPELGECRLDHIAIAVEDLDESIEMYSHLGLKFDEKRIIVESQKVETAFCHITEDSHLELLRPTSEESSIFKFLKNKGAGIHHLCFSVKDISLKQKELEKQGFKFLYEEAFLGANNSKVNFIHPKSMKGVLVEISERKKD